MHIKKYFEILFNIFRYSICVVLWGISIYHVAQNVNVVDNI